jgi:hypothetical protein
MELGRLHRILELKYTNDHNGGYTYINSVSGESIPLTPFTMKEWAHAMVDCFLQVKSSTDDCRLAV